MEIQGILANLKRERDQIARMIMEIEKMADGSAHKNYGQRRTWLVRAQGSSVPKKRRGRSPKQAG